MKTEQILTALEAKHQGEKEYLQAVRILNLNASVSWNAS